ncbi:MAG TPA: GNAT family N-acetyltransferase [Oscillospiraceae bacterium]|nr:GNAT family N-acetyltransferase [Oscillospiraceae bacterium]HXK76917.1 GNAT family N-acetyltransferase [Oscillospiraceae bacterium]
MLDYLIRPVRPEDADDINIIRRQPETARFMLAIPSERIEQSENFINNLRPNNYEFVAVVPQACGCERVIGMAGMEQGARPRTAHTAEFGICVHKDYQDQGVGTALLRQIIDLADNWLGLTRIELEVDVDNDRAIHLYQKFGFEIEGRKRMAVLRDGQYVDTYLMSRIKEPPRYVPNGNQSEGN